MDPTDNMMPSREDAGITPAPIHAMAATSFLTPQLDLDGNTLAFIGPIEAGREAETFATLLTFTVFAEQPAWVIDEAYSSACAETGVSCRLSEDKWYSIASEYFDEFIDYLNSASTQELHERMAWLDQYFFSRHHGYDDARIMIERFLAARELPLH